MHNRYTQSSTFISQNFVRKKRERKKTNKPEEKNNMARLILIWQNAYKWKKNHKENIHEYSRSTQTQNLYQNWFDSKRKIYDKLDKYKK